MNCIKRLFKKKDNWKMKNTSGRLYEVAGAGHITITGFPHLCGGRAGFGFGVSWGEYGYIGGVLGMEEARRLANDLLEIINAQTETEEELYLKS